jgi:FkbM family methyltransferase
VELYGYSVVSLMKLKSALRPVKLFLSWARSAGWWAAISYTIGRAMREFGFQGAAICSIRPHRTKYRFVARLGNSSDLDVFRQIFLGEEYACLRDISSPTMILDLGANVGYSSAYLLSSFPTAFVFAVEPDPANFEILRKNLAQYGERAKVLRGAVWSHDSRLKVSRKTFGDGREWATQVVARQDDEDVEGVDGFGVLSLLRLANAESVDLLKIDIERSELELFNCAARSWLPRIKNICIELHGDDCRKAFMTALQGFDFDMGTSGELTICRNLRRSAAPL